jgi:hypothetical protein
MSSTIEIEYLRQSNPDSATLKNRDISRLAQLVFPIAEHAAPMHEDEPARGLLLVIHKFQVFTK